MPRRLENIAAWHSEKDHGQHTLRARRKGSSPVQVHVSCQASGVTVVRRKSLYGYATVVTYPLQSKRWQSTLHLVRCRLHARLVVAQGHCSTSRVEPCSSRTGHQSPEPKCNRLYASRSSFQQPPPFSAAPWSVASLLELVAILTPKPSQGRAMALLWRSDESLSKRDDDLVLPGGPRPWPRLQSTRVPRRRTLARLVAYALALFILLFLLRRALGYQVHASTSHSNLHSELYGSDDIRPPRGFVPPDPAEPPSKSPLNSRPKPDHQSQAEAERPELNSAAKQLSTEATDGQTHRDYTGKLHFPSLAKSLITISNTGGSLPKNRNVLFAAASVESISTLLPMACQMASERQNYVHFAILSRSELPVTDLLKVNGIQLDDQCPVIVHGIFALLGHRRQSDKVRLLTRLDARPDSLARSTELRMILATVRAFCELLCAVPSIHDDD